MPIGPSATRAPNQRWGTLAACTPAVDLTGVRAGIRNALDHELDPQMWAARLARPREEGGRVMSDMNRRDFLKASGLAAGAVLAASTLAAGGPVGAAGAAEKDAAATASAATPGEVSAGRLGGEATTYPIPAVPIPNQEGALPVEEFSGRPAVPHSVSAKPIPPNPAMDEAPWNNFHDDTYMSDTYTVAGPLGRDASVFSTYLGTAEAPYGPPANITFDRWGNLVAVVVHSPVGSMATTLTLTLLDPVTLDTLAVCALPD